MKLIILYDKYCNYVGSSVGVVVSLPFLRICHRSQSYRCCLLPLPPLTLCPSTYTVIQTGERATATTIQQQWLHTSICTRTPPVCNYASATCLTDSLTLSPIPSFIHSFSQSLQSNWGLHHVIKWRCTEWYDMIWYWLPPPVDFEWSSKMSLTRLILRTTMSGLPTCLVVSS